MDQAAAPTAALPGFRAAERRRVRRALLFLALPCLFVAGAYLLPIAAFLFAAIDNRPTAAALPRTIAALSGWPGLGAPEEAAFRALAEDLRAARDGRRLAALSAQLDAAMPGLRQMITRTLRRLPPPSEAAKPALIAADARWGELAVWQVLRREGQALTARHLLAAIDLVQAPDGEIGLVPEDRRLFLGVLLRSAVMAAQVTLGALLIGFPVAHLLSRLPPRRAALLMFLVLLPFWTSLLVRTTAWAILLEERGVINGLLLAAGLVEAPVKLMYNRAGAVVAMIYVALPFMILPLHATMRGIPPAMMRAASAHGATPQQAFRLVYLPQAMPGVVAGCVTVAVTTIGYYVTPLLIGGPGDQMLSYFIAFFVNGTLNWPMAAALASLLVVLVLASLWAVHRSVGLHRLAER